jgi:hypothetical protein
MGDDRSTPSTGRKRRMTAAQLAHKRELDRKAQRINREKTKNRISHLEALVEALQGGDDVDRTKALVSQIDQQKLEIHRLQSIVNSVATLVSVPDRSRQPAPQPAGALRDRRSSTDTGSDAVDEPFTVKQEGSSPEAMSIASSPEEPPHSPVCNTSRPLSHPKAPSLDQQLSRSRTKESITQMASDIYNNTSLEGRMWFICGSILRYILANIPPSQINYEHDDDIAIRAVFEGWSAVMEKHPLDKGWQWLKEVDERIYFHRCEPFRLMHLRNCRLIFLRQMFRNHEFHSKLPPFMAATPLENTLEHDPLVEYFPWPGLRNRMLYSPTMFATNKFMDNLRCRIEFVWNESPHTMYAWSPGHDRYIYSDRFHTRIQDLRFYPGTVDFFESFPELKSVIPLADASLNVLKMKRLTYHNGHEHVRCYEVDPATQDHANAEVSPI